jgi:hypothetical protein
VTAVLSKRALNRSLLARQLLLDRVELPAIEVVERLVGMQAQNPLDPYTALWSRVSGFRPDELSALISERRAVRATAVMRTTIHLLSARDALTVRALMQPIVERAWRYSPFVRQLDGVDVDAVMAAGLEMLAERPHTASELGRRLQERWPDHEPGPLAYAIRFLVPLVQPPPRGLWGGRGPALLQTTTGWLGAPMDPAPSIDDLVLRYLAAFGPATPRDAQTWSWLTGLREVFERLRPRLRTFRDERGRELFDVPDGPMPDPDTPAPVRFLPEYDNLVLSHHDRSRVLDRKFGSGDWLRGSVLVDGFVGATWRIDTKAGAALLEVRTIGMLADADRLAVEEEAARLVEFLAGDAQTRQINILEGS